MISRTPRDRAHIVCVHCHARKVKCDLQESLDEICSNCRKFEHTCIRRTGARKRRKVAQQATPSPQALPDNNNQQQSEDPVIQDSILFSPSESLPPITPGDRIAHATKEPISLEHGGFIADHSALAYDAPTQLTVSEDSIPQPYSVRNAILEATKATTLTREPLRRALIDSFFDHALHIYPVIEPEDVSSPNSSILLQQAVCMVGSLMRRADDSLQLAHSLYEKVKTLIYLNYEPDSLITLKALCLMSCWSVKPPDRISLDGPWYWTGLASRLAFQMGLHRESTYADRPYAGCLRRIYWQLYNADKVQVASWGRPPTFIPQFMQVKPPTLDDFQTKDLRAECFIHGTRLCVLIGSIAELHLQTELASKQKILDIITSLSSWLQELPDDLQLYDQEGARRRFSRPVSEIFIMYFVAIIMLQLLQDGTDQQTHTSVRSLIASSCITRLYEEIHIREHTTFLFPIHSLYCMIASLPQIHYRPRWAEKEALHKEEINILCSIMTSMRGKYGGSDMVLRKIERLRNEVENTSNQCLLDGSSTQHNLSEFRALFPFPTSICSHMDLIQEPGNAEEDLFDDCFIPVENEWRSWLLTEGHGFADLLGVYPEG